MNTLLKLNTEDIQSFTSASKDRIRLPYAWQDSELIWETSQAVWNAGKDLEDIDYINAYLVLRPQQMTMLGFVVDITTKDGQNIQAKIPMRATKEEVTTVLELFFQSGGNGLDEEIRVVLYQQHRKYREPNRKTDFMRGMLIKGYTVDQVLHVIVS